MTLEAVTIDAYGTLVSLRDPVANLQRALAARGVDRDDATVRAAFAAEVAYYAAHSHEPNDAASLEAFRAACAQVFTAAADADLSDFAEDFGAALVFEELPGARDACRSLRDAGLALAIVSNWDIGLHEHLDRLGLAAAVDAVVTSADVGIRKPAPDVLLEAMERLGIEPAAAVHIGDDPADEASAAAAGMRFEPAPLAGAAQRILA
jgi:putative hydrolase of the HAD superfamily